MSFEAFEKRDPVIDGEKKDQKDAKKTLSTTDDLHGDESYGQDTETKNQSDKKESAENQENKNQERKDFLVQNTKAESVAQKKDPPPDEAEIAMAFNDFPPKSSESQKSQANTVDGVRSESLHA